MKKSLDPRVNRMDLPENGGSNEVVIPDGDAYEVFVQTKSGDSHVHVGSLHAPNPEMAFVFAKEQYARRERCHNIWVIKTSHVHVMQHDNADMFANNKAKKYRLPAGFKVSDKITAFKNRKTNTK